MSILSTREWATLIWGLLFLVYIMCHKEIRKSFWKVIVIFFDKKLRILWEIILHHLYILVKAQFMKTEVFMLTLMIYPLFLIYQIQTEHFYLSSDTKIIQ